MDNDNIYNGLRQLLLKEEDVSNLDDVEKINFFEQD
jgi:hypothetical protein